MSAEVVHLADLRRARDAQQGREPWLSKQQIAAHLGFSTRWVEQRVAQGMPSEVWGSRRRFRISDVEQWLRKESA